MEIDNFAFIGFSGVQQLVDAVGGVDVTLTEAVSDPYYWVSASKRGITFPKGRNHLDGARALIFARTRKGDNDFERARRQQVLVAAAVEKVAAKGVSILPQLLTIGSRWVRTDLPLAKMVAIYDIATKADLGTDQRVVFGPRTWATGIPGSTSFYLNLPVVRKKIDQWMPAVAAPSPSPSPSPSGSPSPTFGAPAVSPGQTP